MAAVSEWQALRGTAATASYDKRPRRPSAAPSGDLGCWRRLLESERLDWQRRTAAGHLTSLERAARNASRRYHTRSGCEENRRGAIGSLSLSLTEADSGYSLPGDADDTVSEQHGVSGRHTYGVSGPLAPSRSPTRTGCVRTTGYVLYNYTLVLHVNHLI